MKNRTKFLLKCLEICSKPESQEFDTWENISYFCNAAAAVGYDYDSDCEKQEYLDAVDLFNNLYKSDALKYIFEELCDYNQVAQQDYLSIGGYFGKHSIAANQNHRLMAIAFAAAVSETED